LLSEENTANTTENIKLTKNTTEHSIMKI